MFQYSVPTNRRENILDVTDHYFRSQRYSFWWEYIIKLKTMTNNIKQGVNLESCVYQSLLEKFFIITT